jgi:signal peptidase I
MSEKYQSDRDGDSTKGEFDYNEDDRRSRIREKYFGGVKKQKQKGDGDGDKKPGFFISLLVLLLNIVVIIAAVIGIRTFVISPFSVSGTSMVSTFENGDLILVDKLSYRLGEPQRGDVIVFRPPVNRYTSQPNIICKSKQLVWQVIGKDPETACDPREHFVKRVIGIPGDTVEVRNGDVFVTPLAGERVEIREDFLDTKNQNRTCFVGECNSSRDINGEFFEVPTGHVYVLGDNRSGSSDSREWSVNGRPAPFVPYEDISGKVRMVFFPFTNFGWVTDIDLMPGN